MKKNRYTLLSFITALMLFSQPLFSQNKWYARGTFPGGGRCYSAYFSVGNKGYICSGSLSADGLSNFTNEVWEFDPISSSWTQKNNFPGTASKTATGFSINNKGFVISGTKLWEYNPAGDSWTAKADFPGNSGGLVVFSLGGKAYAGLSVMNTDWWEYDPAVNSWTQKTSLPVAGVYMPSFFTVNQKGYVCGGSGMNGRLKLWQYDASLNTWTLKLDTAAINRSEGIGHSGSARGYVGLGITSFAIGADFWGYDPFTNTFEKEANLGTVQRLGAAAFSINDSHYVATGVSNMYQFLNETSMFWDTIPASPINGTISITHLASGNCGNETMKVGFRTTGFSSSATFSLYLSDSAGNFINKQLLAQKLSANMYDTIQTNVPSGIVGSLHYKLRIESASPAAISAASNAVSLAPKPAAINISGPSTLFEDSVGTYTVNGNSTSSYVWLTSGATGSSTGNTINLNWATFGNKTVKVIESSVFGCKGDTAATSIEVKENIGVGILDLQASPVRMVYPNPVSDLLTVELTSNSLSRFFITNITGKAINEGYAKSSLTIDTKSWHPGIYFLCIDGYAYKFIKE